MSTVTFIPWKNQLADLVREPGGVKIVDALDQASKNLETIRESTLTAVDAQIEQIERLCADTGARPADAVKQQIYFLASDIHAVAGVFGLGELGEAALSLCDLVDRFRTLDRWNQAAVDVHLSSFRLLRRPSPNTDRSAVIQNLRRLSEGLAAGAP